MERLKVLLSAYACEPGKGSEPEVGWQWALQMARFHDVTVLTRSNNEPAIAAALRDLPVDRRPRFLYLDLPRPFLKLKKCFRLHKAYYGLWQRQARRVFQRLLATERFDLLHHVTYAGARFPAAIFGQGRPCIFGPVGGFESVPWGLLPWRHPVELAAEIARNFGNAWQTHGPSLRRKVDAASLTLASTIETQEAIAKSGRRSELLPTIGLHTGAMAPRPAFPAPSQGELRLLFAGNVLYLKGLEFAVHALCRTSAPVVLTIIGDGKFLAALRRLADRLKLGSRVQFPGRVSRDEMLRAYAEYDVFLFPSLHDSGGFSLIEAMAAGLPAICLDCAGPRVAVTDDCGIKVPLGSRAAVIAGLAAAIERYARDPALRLEHGRRARLRIETVYDWDRKAEAMNRFYSEVMRRQAPGSPTPPGRG